ncbi:MAG: hypothetical protein MJ109_04555 [Kiritimatiellae bacterium]|nr:hypothetical protein [Kiritimatiellia bacterium]
MKRQIIGAAIVAMSAMSLWAVPGTIVTENDSKTGDVKWQTRQKQYVVSVKKGSTMIDVEVKPEEIVKLDIKKPDGLDKSIKAVQEGQGAAAIPTLQKIADEYKMLIWDKIAGRYLVQAYLSSGNAQKAYDAATKIVSDDKEAAYKGALAPAYWQALLKLNKIPQLEKAIKDAKSKGDRASSAAAMVVSGDLILAKGAGSQESYKQALTDAYLRVALMYNDEPCREARIDAMNRAADCFDKLGQATRAENMRDKAKSLQ